MDSEVSVMLHCAPAQGFEEHQVQVEISSRFNRRSVPEMEKHIEVVWSDRVAKEPWLFNGAKFRLHSAELFTTPSQICTDTASRSKTAEADRQLGIPSFHCRGGEHISLMEKDISLVNAKSEKSSCCREAKGEPKEDTRPSEVNGVILRLQLGLTCYKDFLGTNWSQEAVNLQQRGRLESGDTQALLAQPLGVGAVLVTSDGQVVMLRRSQRIAEAAGLLDIPGGHPEPKAVCQGVREEDISVDLMQGCERAVVAEIFSSVCAEVRDEVCAVYTTQSTTCYRRRIWMPDTGIRDGAGECSTRFSQCTGSDGNSTEPHQCRTTQRRVLHQVYSDDGGSKGFLSARRT
ncbi:uridine diphosphate glucose pyrophosphatase NUDT22 isoform X3 [Tachysurus fulvidraco]|uniref:uridine diphosphate glucose pyrophosphatase NUDT22 isoform X3 n=1 Tax=Tachysurus fulvidraco TaxID=1234273 RepID=UPI001FEFFB46|nr:uridine diphosphate glucose pyrophosphatase NUDT22 isoform X3 [Tachysurus fulvidraco]